MRHAQIVGYDIAQICRNGHVVNSASQHYSRHNQPYCSKCGAETIQHCPSCQKPIRGEYHGGLVSNYYERPAHCLHCGHPYPWTEAAVKAARDFAANELSQADQNELADIIENLVRDNGAPTVVVDAAPAMAMRPAFSPLLSP